MADHLQSSAQGRRRSPGDIVWMPEPDDITDARVTSFMAWLRDRRRLDFDTYEALLDWSTSDLSGFWGAIWDYFGVDASTPFDRVLAEAALPGTRWFPGAQLNYAEHVLRTGNPDDIAILAVEEGQTPIQLTWSELRGQVGALAAHLRQQGVRPGDRVAGYLPNIPAAVVGMLATTGIGAVWVGVAPDFGTRSVLDRLRQVEPVVLVAADGYVFNGKPHHRSEVVAELVAALPSVRHTVLVQALAPDATLPSDSSAYSTVIARPVPLQAVHVASDHPLWVLFSSGTTGKPKGIVQSHAGILLEHLKALGLCLDLGPDDTYFFHSSTSWMAWNFLVGGLLHGSTIVLYSGSPTYDGVDALWRVAAEVEATVLGMGAAYASGCAKAAVTLDVEQLHSLRVAIPTGSPLAEAGWDWLTDQLPPHTRIDPICGGTDVCTVFFGGSSLLPVRKGRISSRWLGVDAHAFDAEGRPHVGAVGEFVVRSPMPSMPLRLWGDDDDSRLAESYFSRYPGVWAQGDWIEIDSEGSVQVLGRSDATLNRGGVRLGSAELYTVVEGLPEVADSLAVGVELPDGEYYLPLFVVTHDGHEVDDQVRGRIVAAVRAQLSARHVPDEIIQAPGLPRTLTGKKLEIPVKRILQGARASATVAEGAIDRPELLGWFEEFATRRRPPSGA